jgi:glycosyltransferase involved in cell wall biosynthesis
MAGSSIAKALTKPIWKGVVLDGATVVHVLTRAEKLYSQEYCRAPIEVIPPGIQIPEIGQPNMPGPNGRYVLFLGRVHPHKRVELLIDALAQLNPETRPSLVVAGQVTANYRVWLESIAAGRIAPPTFTGHVDGSDRERLLGNALLLAVVSKSENLSMVALEAMVRRRPVLVTRNLDIAADIEEASAGMVCDPSSRDIARGIDDLLDRNTWLRLSRNGHEFALRFDLLKSTETLLRSYQRVLVNQGGDGVLRSP